VGNGQRRSSGCKRKMLCVVWTDTIMDFVFLALGAAGCKGVVNTLLLKL